SHPVVRRNAFYGQGRGQIALSGLECSGAEESIFDCKHHGLGVVADGCDHLDDVGVDCQPPFLESPHIRLAHGPSKWAGRIEIQIQPGVWETICGRDFGVADAEENILHCPHDGLGMTSCSHEDDAGVDCFPQAPEVALSMGAGTNETTNHHTLTVLSGQDITVTCQARGLRLDSLRVFRQDTKQQLPGNTDDKGYDAQDQKVIGAPTLVSNNYPYGSGTEANPFNVTAGSHPQTFIFELESYPLPHRDSHVVFMGEALPANFTPSSLPNSALSTTVTVLCETSVVLYRATCSVFDISSVVREAGFYALTLRNDYGDVTVFFQREGAVEESAKSTTDSTGDGRAEPAGLHLGVYIFGGITAVVVVVLAVVGVFKVRRYSVMRTYDRCQRPKEMSFYSRLGRAILGREDVRETDEEVYHMIDDSHIGPESEASEKAASLCHRRRLFSSEVTLHPSAAFNLTQSDCETKRNRRSSLPSDYLHPVTSFPDRRQCLSSDYLHPVSSLSNNQKPLSSDYLHPMTSLSDNQRSLSSDYLHPVTSLSDNQRALSSDYLHPVTSLSDNQRALSSDYLHPVTSLSDNQRALSPDYLHPVTSLSDNQRALSSDYLHPVTSLSDNQRSLSSDYLHPVTSLSDNQRSLSSDYLHLVTSLSDNQRALSPDYLHPVTSLSDNQRSLSSDYLHPVTSLSDNQRALSSDYLHPVTSLSDNQRALSSDYLHPVTSLSDNQRALSSDYLHPVTSLSDNQRALSSDYLHPVTSLSDNQRALSPDYLHPVTSLSDNQRALSSDYLHPVTSLSDNQRALSPDYLHPVTSLSDNQRALSSDYLHPVTSLSDNQRALSSDYLHPVTSLSDNQRALSSDYLHPVTSLSDNQRALSSDYLHPVTSLSDN
ncbi:hypothetical protein BaRGS_00017762, partial [Batillaria attramentaria]